MARLKRRKDENARLKRLPADAMLDNAAVQALQKAVAHLVEGHGMSDAIARQAIAMPSAERWRARLVIGRCRMTMRYEPIRQDNPVLQARLKEMAKA